MTEQLTDYDSPWKEVIELYFPRFMEFFFTQAYAEIGASQDQGNTTKPRKSATVETKPSQTAV